jgi:hypothetical protein
MFNLRYPALSGERSIFMYRVIQMGDTWYAAESDDFEDAADDIQALVESGDVVILAEDLEEIADALGIETEAIEQLY